MKDRKPRSDRWRPESRVAEAIIKKYNDGQSARQLGFEYRVADITITALLRRGEVKIRNRSDARRTTTLNENAFDTITEESAYWIGFLLADGNIFYSPKRSKQLSLGLADKDWEHIEKFKKFIGSDKQLYYNENNHGVFIAIYSDQIGDKLAEYGIVPCKSKIAKTPESLKDNRHFWRGMVDGDGWVSFSDGRYPVVGTCGTEDVVQSFVRFTGKDASIRRRIHSGCYETAYSCTTAQILARRLYEDSRVFLQRKYDKFLKIKEWTPQRPREGLFRCII